MSDPIKILVVEDDINVATVLSARLEHFDYSVSGVAQSGPMAIHQFNSYPPDLILMDILLEGEMNGIDVAEKITSFSDVPVIFLSCLNDQSMMDRAIEIRPFAYLVKPYDTAELRFTIENTLLKYRADKEREKLITKLETDLQKDQKHDGFIPIRSGCKQIRDAKGHWQAVESYIASHLGVAFSHGICPVCIQRFYPELRGKLDNTEKATS